MVTVTIRWVILGCLSVVSVGHVLFARVSQAADALPSPLTRRYQEGERLAYRMKASNRNRTGTTDYEATARGVVRRDASGSFYEEYEWADIVWNGVSFTLPEVNRGFRQRLSLAAGDAPSLPDFSTLHPRLVGPTTDLMTFYADVWLAVRQVGLRQPGDQARVAHGRPASWADGARVVLGEDSIDFVLTLGAPSASGTRELTVRHVPPAQTAIRIPADWMRIPVADTPNNWIQVMKLSDGRYIAAVGKEIFDAKIRLSLETGKITSAELENPVDVFERECRDEALTQCGDGLRYQILRRIQLDEMS
jgi:hypothetical protein